MPFQKGKSGNPDGRPPKGSAVADVLNDLLTREVLNTSRNKVQVIEAICEKLIDLAMEGDLKAINILLDRVDGKPRQQVAIEQSSPEPLVIRQSIVHCYPDGSEVPEELLGDK